MTEPQKQFEALVAGKLDVMSGLLQCGVDVDAVADHDTATAYSSHISRGDTLVHTALHTENLDALELLLQCGANLNVGAEDGVTPLQIAVNKGLDDIAVWLLEHGANFNTMDKYGLTPLHYTDNRSIIRWILAKGVAVDVQAHSTGYTPLHYAAYHYQKNKMVILLESHADPVARGLADETPLHLLVCREYRRAEAGVVALIGANADINAQDDRGNTPLHWALGANSDRDWLHRGNAESIRALLDHGADPNIKNAKKLTPAAMVKKSRNPKFLDAFKEGVK